MTTTDDLQAAEYRRKMLARTRHKVAQEKALAGSSAERSDLQANWQPLIDWFNELERYDDGREDCEDTGQILNLNPGIE